MFLTVAYFCVQSETIKEMGRYGGGEIGRSAYSQTLMVPYIKIPLWMKLFEEIDLYDTMW